MTAREIYEMYSREYMRMLNKVSGPGNNILNPYIIDVKFNGPATIVFWSDKEKTVVKCDGENFDREKGLAMAISKRFIGTNESKSNYYKVFDKYCNNYDPEYNGVEHFINGIREMNETIDKSISSSRRCYNCKYRWTQTYEEPCTSCDLPEHSNWEGV